MIKNENSTFSSTLLNAIPVAAALLNDQGDVITVNRFWYDACDKSPYFGADKTGCNYFDVLAAEAKSGSDYGLKMILGLRSLIDKQEPEFSLLYSECVDGSVNWYKMTIVRAEGDVEGRLVVKHEKWLDTWVLKATNWFTRENNVPILTGSHDLSGTNRQPKTETEDRNHKKRETTTYESELEKSLYEKEILLQEVHHRVKNNLAVISGLIELQVMDDDNKKVNRKLKQVQNRIISIAQIHESIYQNGNLVNVEMDAYFKRFARHMTYFNDEKYLLELDLEPVQVNLNLAVSFGLLINELMILICENDESVGRYVNFKLSQLSDVVELEMSSDCLWFQNIENLRGETRFNFKIIHVLLQQLNATFEFSNSSPRSLKISFKNTIVKGSSSLHF